MEAVRLLSDLKRMKIARSCLVPAALAAFWLFMVVSLLRSGGVLKRTIGDCRVRLEKARAYLAFIKKEEDFRFVYNRERVGGELTVALAELQRVASDAGLHITALRPQQGQECRQGPGVVATPIAMTLEGTEDSFIRFLRELRRLSFLCRPVSLDLAPQRSGDGTMHVQLVVEKIDKARGDRIGRVSKPFPPLDYRAAGDPLASFTPKRIFKTPAVIKPKNIQAASGEETAPLKDLYLVGIVDDGGVRAVIEDKKALKTYFLNTGDRLGQATVVAIKGQEVILEVGREQYTMAL